MKVDETTELTLDLKTISMIVGGTIALAGMWFTLQADIQDLNKVKIIPGSKSIVETLTNIFSIERS